MALPSLTTEEIIKIEALIKQWTTKFTWELLVKRIKNDLDIDTTRQTLPKYSSIKKAYQKKKKQLSGKPVPEDSLDYLEKLSKFTRADIDRLEQIEKLEAEIEVLREKVKKQLAFIKKLSELADTNPSLLELLNRTKNSLPQKRKE
ncbi:hypothetical protein [Vibrio harveyi]|uniref:hypothetical protein n=1 Tax=Vibrio harveyi TaxID=669 RepID=UPI0002C49272|nr:hypothetical protein [Vibrio harveyi]EJL6383361.1 hypothetical protein [Vibrio parahaemolyticus]EMR35195.1 hypothetical protein MUQ_19668 [Vibrio harveyi CAIM 1792]